MGGECDLFDSLSLSHSLHSQANATIVKIDSSAAEVFYDSLKLITRTFVLVCGLVVMLNYTFYLVSIPTVVSL